MVINLKASRIKTHHHPLFTKKHIGKNKERQRPRSQPCFSFVYFSTVLSYPLFFRSFELYASNNEKETAFTGNTLEIIYSGLSDRNVFICWDSTGQWIEFSTLGFYTRNICHRSATDGYVYTYFIHLHSAYTRAYVTYGLYMCTNYEADVNFRFLIKAAFVVVQSAVR